jgi:hypothetical protein
MPHKSIGSLIAAFIAAVVLATLWGAIVQTQFNLAGLNSIGAEISSGVRWQTTLSDIFSGFTPTYGSYVVAPSLLVGFVVAWLIADDRYGRRLMWFGLAGGLALLAGIPLVNYLAPVALLIGATRDWACTILMALGGSVAGWLFVWMSTPRPRARELESRTVAA